MNRTGYPSDVSDEEWAFAAPYLTLMSETAAQRDHSLREVFNGLRWLIRTGAPWRMRPHDLPPWAAVYQQTQRWWRAGVFEAMVSDRRAILRLAAGRNASPSAAIIDSRTLQSSPESGARAGYDGAKRKRACTTHPRSVSGPCDRVFQPIPFAAHWPARSAVPQSGQPAPAFLLRRPPRIPTAGRIPQIGMQASCNYRV
jgi:transposase